MLPHFSPITACIMFTSLCGQVAVRHVIGWLPLVLSGLLSPELLLRFLKAVSIHSYTDILVLLLKGVKVLSTILSEGLPVSEDFQTLEEPQS